MKELKERELAQQAQLRLLEQLNDTQSRYESLVSTLDDVVFQEGTHGLTFLSHAWKRLMNRDIDPCLGHPLSAYVEKASLEDYERWASDLAESGKTSGHITTQLITSDHQPVWVEINASFIPSSGEIAGVIRNVSDRIRLEERIQQKTIELKQSSDELVLSEERLRFAMEASKDGIWDWNIVTGKTYCSPSYYRMLGYEQDSMALDVDALFLELLHPEDRDVTFSAIERYLLDPGHYQIQFRMKSKSGVYLWIESKGKVVEFGPEGQPLRAIGTHTDITERKVAAMALAESEQRFKDMADSAPVMIWLAGTDTLCSYFNKIWLDFTGRTLDQEIGNGWAEGVHPDDFDQCLKTYLTSFERREPFTMDYRLMRHDGCYRWIQDSGTPRFASNGRFHGYIGSCIDITERKTNEDAIRELNLNLEQKVRDRTAELANASAAKSQFLAHMSHEIRTPLNAILGLAQILSRSARDPDQGQMIRKIGDAGQTLLHIINDILDLSKIEAGQIMLDESPFHLSSVLKRVQDLLQTTSDSKDLSFIVNAAPALRHGLQGDAQRLEQILINLTANAIKFTEKGKVEVKSSVMSMDDTFIRVRFEVVDTGMGIPEDIQTHLFEPFSQGDPTVSRRFGGTGLGLVISKRLVESMNGTIGLTSTPGQGSCFWFEIPFHLAEGEAVLTQQPSPVMAGNSRLAGKHILAVDDNQLNQYLIEELLKKEGATVTLACNGQDALDRLSASPKDFDLVLMDIQMPVMDGLSATRIIRSIPALMHLPVIAVSAGVLAPEREAANSAGVDDFLSKPLNTEELVSVLLRYLQCAGQAKAKPNQDTTLAPIQRPYESTPGLDPARAREIAGLDPSFYEELLTLFLSEFAQAAKQGRSHIEKGQHLDARAYFRKLKGTAANIGAVWIMETAKDLEDMTRTDAGEQDYAPLFQKLEDNFRALKLQCASWLPGVDAP